MIVYVTTQIPIYMIKVVSGSFQNNFQLFYLVIKSFERVHTFELN